MIYYGWYSQASRGKRKKEGRLTTDSPFVHKQVENDNKQIRYRWSQLIKMVYSEGPISYEPFFDDLPEDEQIKLMQAMN